MARETLPGDPVVRRGRHVSAILGALLIYLGLAMLLTAEAWGSPTTRWIMAMRLLVGCACTDRSVRSPCVRAGALPLSAWDIKRNRLKRAPTYSEGSVVRSLCRQPAISVPDHPMVRLLGSSGTRGSASSVQGPM
jgi:hypothetical protein